MINIVRTCETKASVSSSSPSPPYSSADDGVVVVKYRSEEGVAEERDWLFW